jgi:hypothetical protein
MFIEPGTIVGSYRVEGILGRGGMGVVYSASHVELDRRVALKVLAEDLSQSPEFVERFRREGRLQAALEHPHAVTIYEAGDGEYGLYLAMRLVAGPTLALLIQERALDAGRALRLLGQVADALDAAHAAGLVHRDVKPQNVLVGDADDAYLGDFGLMRVGGSAGVTATGRLLGTIAYLAPEVVHGEDATAASDLYAFAAMSFECLTGTVVFPRGTEAAVLYAHTNEPPPSASTRRAQLPTTLDAIFVRALAKDPADRPKSTKALVDRISSALEDAGAGALEPPPFAVAALDAETIEPLVRAQPPAPRTRWRTWPWVAAAALAGAVVALGGRELLTDGNAEAAVIPVPLPGAVVLGSDLRHAGRTLDCREHDVTPVSPECTIVQTALPGATVVVPQDGVIRRWSVRSAHGELSLAGLRSRKGGASQFTRSPNEFVESDGVFTFATDLAVERGDLVGLVVIGGSGVGARPADGATTERWIPHVPGFARPPEFPAGRGFDDELFLRVELIPGAKQRLPHEVDGAAASRLPGGRVLVRKGSHTVDGRFFEVDTVEVDKRIVLDELIGGHRFARIDVPGFPPGGHVVTFEVTPSGPGAADSVDVYIEYVAAGSARLLSHFYGADSRGLEFVN